MPDRALYAERTLEIARELRAVIEETRQSLETSRDLVRRSREQQRAFKAPLVPLDNDPGPSTHLVECLLEAFEAAQTDTDTQTRSLIGGVIHHVGCRIANTIGPKGVGAALN